MDYKELMMKFEKWEFALAIFLIVLIVGGFFYRINKIDSNSCEITQENIPPESVVILSHRK